jgi:hypothetical protein
VAPQVPETLLHYLSSGPSPPSNTTKVAIEVFTSLYPLLFRLCCEAPQNPALARAWSAIEQLKARTAAAYDSIAPAGKAGTGVRIAVFKFWQRAVLVGTRAANDPRVSDVLQLDGYCCASMVGEGACTGLVTRGARHILLAAPACGDYFMLAQS